MAHRGICLQNHFAPLVSCLWGQAGCQKKQKTSRNSIFLVWCATFQSKLKNLQKRPKLNQKHEKNAIFWAVFWNLCNFDWKVAHQTKKFEFLEVLRFFWHPVCPQRRETSGDIPIWTFCFENLTTVVPSRIFFVFFKIKSEVCFTGLRLKKGYFYNFSVWNHMNLRLLQSTIAVFWNDLWGKYPCVDFKPIWSSQLGF